MIRSDVARIEMLNIPHVNHVNFKRHFIDKVICELRFPSLKKIDWSAKISAKFSSAMSGVGFDLCKPAIESNLHIQASKKNPKIQGVNLQTRVVGLLATSSKSRMNLQFRADRLILTSPSYNGFSEFWKEIRQIIPACESVWGQLHFNWIGIRKVNIIGIESDDGIYEGQGANPLIFAPLRQGNFNPKLVKGAETRYSLGDDETTCNIVTKCSREANPKRVKLIIDIDLNRVIKPPQMLKELDKTAEELNNTIFDIFCWITDSNLLEQMRKD